MSRIIFLIILVISGLDLAGIIETPALLDAALFGTAFSLLINIIVDSRLKRAKDNG